MAVTSISECGTVSQRFPADEGTVSGGDWSGGGDSIGDVDRVCECEVVLIR